MKNLKYLVAIFFAAVVFTSCTTTQQTTDDNLDGVATRRVGNRVYVEDPYSGTVILERDLATGRYYDVTYGSRGFGYYNYPYNGWNNRIYRGNNRGYGSFNHNTGRRLTQLRPVHGTR